MKNLIIRSSLIAFLLVASHGLVSALEINDDSKNFIGNLNKTKFEFPHGYVRNVEYNGDPGWGYEKRIKEVRSWDSTFRSLGFRMSYPDFILLKNSQSLGSIVRVTLTGGEYFGDGFFLDRSFQGINRDPNYLYRESNSVYELRYFPLTIDSSIAKKSVMRDFDIYVKNDKDGKVKTLIRCGNNHGAQSLCMHFFQIDEYKARITLNYKRQVLCDWKLIQNSTISKLQEFRK